MKNKFIWFDGRNLKNQEKILSLVYNLNFEHLLVKKSMYQHITPPKKMNLIVEVDDNEKFDDLDKNISIMSGNEEILKKAKAKGYKTVYYKFLENQKDMDLAWQIGSKSDFLLVDIFHETNIPLELLIARLQKLETGVLKIGKTLEDIAIAFGVMEVGCNGILFWSEDVKEIMEVNNFMIKRNDSKLELVKAKVIDVQHIGMGHRACIDTTTILRKDEGMIIGSTSTGGLLVSSETHFLPYMNLRPFRVNAGAVHSYVWIPENMTSYLTELKAGSKVTCVDTKGNSREVTVGRAKIEIRPLLKIEAEVDGIKINTIVQDDWHIRIFGANGEPLNASKIQVDDELLAYISSGARHVGIKIEEMVEEK
jgi:3-amino-4-hydroxybenzoic acid synthase